MEGTNTRLASGASIKATPGLQGQRLMIVVNTLLDAGPMDGFTADRCGVERERAVAEGAGCEVVTVFGHPAGAEVRGSRCGGVDGQRPDAHGGE